MPENGGMKTSDLTGADLDYWVAKAEGLVVSRPGGWASRMSGGVRIDAPFSPSSDWADGGPIIDRERISLDADHSPVREGDWVAFWREGGFEEGPTPLVAAMRAYVASKFGEEVSGPTAGESPNG